MDFSSGLKSGMSLGIGEAMGPQQSPMVAQIIKQKMASDMQMKAKGVELAATNGEGIEITPDGKLVFNQIYKEYPAFALVAFGKNREKRIAAEREATKASMEQFHSLMGLAEKLDKLEGPMQENVARLLQRGLTQGPLEGFGQILADAGFSFDDIIMEGKKVKEMLEMSMIKVAGDYEKALRDKNLYAIEGIRPYLRMMIAENEEMAKKIGLPGLLEQGFADSEKLWQTEEEKFKRELYELDQKKRVEQKYRDVKTWQTPDKEIVHSRPGEMPPPGSIPHSSQSGIRFTTKGGDTIEIGGFGAELPPVQRMKQQEKFDYRESILNEMEDAIRIIKEKPEITGIQGSARDFIQRLVGAMSDLGVTTLSDRVMKEAEELDLSEKDRKFLMDAFDPSKFDPQISELQMYQNYLAFAVSKLELTEGDTSVRALEGVFKKNQRDFQIFSKTKDGRLIVNQEDVLARFNLGYKRLLGYRNQQAKRIGYEERPGLDAPKKEIVYEFGPDGKLQEVK